MFNRLSAFQNPFPTIIGFSGPWKLNRREGKRKSAGCTSPECDRGDGASRFSRSAVRRKSICGKLNNQVLAPVSAI
jgi:hypothetical protein